MEKKNVYDIVTEKIIAQLQAGVIPWRKPWKDAAINGPQRNAVSGKAYQGINVWITQSAGYTDPRWVSFKQALDLGGNVRKGEKSTAIVYWKILDIEERVNETGEVEKKHIPLVRYYNVFNVEQCDGLNLPVIEKAERPSIAAAEAVITDMPGRPEIRHAGDRAYYSPRIDVITMPTTEFTSKEEYYATLFHELTHSTGHQSRLKRDGITEMHFFGDAIYSKEELIAEMGSAFVCAKTGLDTPSLTSNQAAYLQSWLNVLKADRKMLVLAAAQAQKAANYILNEKPNTEE